VCTGGVNWEASTWVVPAAPGRAAPHPAALVDRHGPLVDLVVLQGVGGQVADLDLGEVLLEVLEGHPGRAESEMRGETNRRDEP